MKLNNWLPACLLLPLLLNGCDSSQDNADDKPVETAQVQSVSSQKWEANAEKTFHLQAQAWQQALDAFQQTPDQAHLTALRGQLENWYASFADQYLLLASRACQLDLQSVFTRLDSWPLYPGYLDSLPQWPDSGLINDPYLNMDRQTLRTQNGATDRAEASLGFAALFVVLNGTEDAPRALEAFSGDDDIVKRRREYLKLASEQLQADRKKLGSTATLTDRALQCGLALTLQQAGQIDSANNDGEGLFTPPALLAISKARLLKGVQDMDESTREDWEAVSPGINKAIEASAKQGWQPLQAWLDTQQ